MILPLKPPFSAGISHCHVPSAICDASGRGRAHHVRMGSVDSIKVPSTEDLLFCARHVSPVIERHRCNLVCIMISLPSPG